MTTPADIRHLLARISNSADIAEARLEHAAANIARNTADSYPTKASGNATGTAGGTSELTATEQAAQTNLGDLWGYSTPDGPDCEHCLRTDGTHTAACPTRYRPGPTTQLADVADNLRAALTALQHAHTAITDCGIPPLITRQYQCHGINGIGCTSWAIKDASHHLCIDCHRTSESNRRRQRRHAAS